MQTVKWKRSRQRRRKNSNRRPKGRKEKRNGLHSVV
jgi:hypothetical protein